MTDQPRNRAAGAWWLLLAMLALSNAGCLVAAAGAAAGGAVMATYAYSRGSLFREYVGSQDVLFPHIRVALSELNMPILRDEPNKNGQGYLEASTADGKLVHIYIAHQDMTVSGEVSRVSVRVGSFGDEAASRRILDQIDHHLTPLTPVPAPATTVTSTPTAKRETPPPPLAP